MGLMSFQSFTLGQYAPQTSWIHGLDPRTKMLALLAIMAGLLAVGRVEGLVFYALLVTALFALSRLPLSWAWRSVRPLWVLIALTLFIHTLFDPRGPAWVLPGLAWRFSWPGLLTGLFFGLRIIVLVLLASLLTLTTAPMAIADGLYRFFRPLERLGLPAQDLAMMISIALRFIPILMEEAQRIYKAQLARGARFSGSLIQRARSVLPILIPLFLSTFRRANELAVAMEVRCYQSGHPRTSLYTLRMGRTDWLALASLVPLLSPVALWH